MLKKIAGHITATLLIFSFACSKMKETKPMEAQASLEIKGADLSNLPEVRQSGLSCYNHQNQIEDMLSTLKKAGANTIRLRIWNNPARPSSSFNTVKNLSNEIKSMGMKVLLTVHYSDTWADPSQQSKPKNWEGKNLDQLADSVFNYTRKIVQEIDPHYIQIGNEINNGLLWPEGNRSNQNQMKRLLKSGISAVRQTNSKTKIIIHFAGFEYADSFYSSLSDLDYNIIGLSYYPMWHGKNLENLKQNLISLSNQYNKPVFIAETSYPFTLSWNDWTHNIIGSNSQILMEYPATPQGQKDYLDKIISLIKDVPKGIGFCYWGAELISLNGPQSAQGSSYENQAFWDFENKSLPILDCFK